MNEDVVLSFDPRQRDLEHQVAFNIELSWSPYDFEEVHNYVFDDNQY